MFLKALYLRNFRCYEEALFQFSPEFNLIIGPNAQGKTTILEAIHLLISGKSFRSPQIRDLVRTGEEHFLVEASFVKHGIEQRIKFIGSSGRRRIFYNGKELASFSSLYGLLCGVLIAPDDAALVKGGPAERRSYLDVQLAQTDPLYVHHLSRFTRAMKQRNAQLKSRRAEGIAVWEEAMSASAAYVTLKRKKAVADLEDEAGPLYALISGGGKQFSLSHKCLFPLHEEKELAAAFLNKYAAQREREMHLGTTLTGPHRDDLAISVGGKEARFFGSEGEQRSCVATLKFSEWKRLEKQAQVLPLMLVDDIGISLDAFRRRKIVQHLSGMGQIFLTSTELPELEGIAGKPATAIIHPETFCRRELQ